MNYLKVLKERRDNLLNEMNGIVGKAEKEERAFEEEEVNKFNELKKAIEQLDETIKALNESRKFDSVEDSEGKKEKTEEEKTDKTTAEKRALEDTQDFLKFIRGEERALNIANNGGIIPNTIADKIIEQVKELSPIYAMATIYNVGGNLIFPKYGLEGSNDIKATYSDDLTELTEQTGKFTTVTLENFIVGCLAKISKSLMNRTDFDLVNFVVRKVAEAIAEFLEKELINGTSGKMSGLASSTNITTSATTGAIAADDLINLQMSIVEQYQNNACWIMNKETLKVLRKLKDNDGNYLLGTLSSGFGWELLGKKVYISENCPQIATGKKAVFYGDMSGLYVKLSQNLEIQMLMEKFATQHAIGVVAYVEADSKIVEEQKIACLQIK